MNFVVISIGRSFISDYNFSSFIDSYLCLCLTDDDVKGGCEDTDSLS